MKKTILFFPLDLMSHYLRCLSIAHVLKREYRVLFQASSKYNEFIRSNGFDVFFAGKKDAGHFIDVCKNDGLLDFSREETDINYQKQVEVLAHIKPDLVISDLVPTANMAAEKLGIPAINLVNAYVSRHFYKRVKLPAYIPADLAKDIYDVPPFFQKQVETLAGLMELGKKQKALRKIRQKYGLSKRNNIGQELEGVHTWVCDLPSIFPLKDNRPDSIKCIGPLFHQAKLSDESWMEQLDKNKPNILVTLGSTGNVDVLTLLQQEVLKHYNIIICGDYKIENTSSNIYFRKFVNFDTILPQIDLVIAHGGNGTVYQALAHAIPIVSIPSFFEQSYNAERIESLGLGQSLNITANALELEVAINTWMGQKGNQKLIRIAKEIKANNRIQSAILLQSVEAVLKAQKTTNQKELLVTK